MWAKTGTLNEANALSGYLTAASGKTLAFSILVNGHRPGQRGRSAGHRPHRRSHRGGGVSLYHRSRCALPYCLLDCPWLFCLCSAGLAACVALAGCRSLPPSKPASQWTPQEARGAQVYQLKCARCHYPTTTHALHGPGLQALTKVKAMPSGAPPTDERLTQVILHGRHDARHATDRRPAPRSAGLPAHAMTGETAEERAAAKSRPSRHGANAAASRAGGHQPLSAGAGRGDHSGRGRAPLSAAVSHLCGRLHDRQRRADAAVALGLGAGSGRGFSAGGLQPVDFLPASIRGRRWCRAC